MENLEIDMGRTIVPKSDQLNSDNLVGGPMTITIRDIKQTDSDQQPISIYFEDDNNKPYKPSLGMRRVLVQLWGINGIEYIGRSLTLFRDETVKFSGSEVGGIVISHASDITEDKRIITTVSRGKKKMLTIKPLNAVVEIVDEEKCIAILNASKDIGKLKDNYLSLTKKEQTNVNVIAKKDELKMKFDMSKS